MPSGKTDGGADRDRTGGLINAIDALSQLSYSPIRLGEAAMYLREFVGVKKKTQAVT